MRHKLLNAFLSLPDPITAKTDAVPFLLLAERLMTIQRIQMTSKTVNPTTVNNSSMVITFVCGCRKPIRLSPNFSTNLLWFMKILYCVYYYDWFVWNIYFDRWADVGILEAKNNDIGDFVWGSFVMLFTDMDYVSLHRYFR